MSAPAVKEVPVFHAASINAMSPLGKEIAKILLEAGYIKIVEDAPEEAG